jgi:hypothetical protein
MPAVTPTTEASEDLFILGIQLPAHPKRQREEKKKKRRETRNSPQTTWWFSLGKMMPKTPRNAPGIEAEPGK